MIQVRVTDIDLEGKGIAKCDNKVIFIYGALPGELVEIEIYKRKANFDVARLIKIIEPSAKRTTPKCPHFGVCGGCTVQHIKEEAQLEFKQKVLLDNLQHIAKIQPIEFLPSLNANYWGYRTRARLSIRFVAKKNRVLVGFHERASSYVADMTRCLILPDAISQLILPLSELIAKLSIKERLPQIEVAVSSHVHVLVLRIMLALTKDDQALIKQFVDQYNQIKEVPLQIWLQPAGVESATPFYPLNSPDLYYKLDKFSLTIPYLPNEFTQINPVINQLMVESALNLLGLETSDTVADFFCGLGNFTLAIATRVTHVYGYELSTALVKRASANASYNNLAAKVTVNSVNLFNIDSAMLAKFPYCNKWLIDPPRDGALELIKALTPEIAPKVIVYVSCNPATLARDAEILVNSYKYTLQTAGVINMFPHTSHVESIAVFTQ